MAPSRGGAVITQGNLAGTYRSLGRFEEAMCLRKEVYSGKLILYGEENKITLIEAGNYASLLNQLKRFKEAKSLLRRTLPVARRVLGENDETTLRMRALYAEALYEDPAATLDDLREAVTKVEETERIARRVLGSAYPLASAIKENLEDARAALAARETPSASK